MAEKLRNTGTDLEGSWKVELQFRKSEPVGSYTPAIVLLFRAADAGVRLTTATNASDCAPNASNIGARNAIYVMCI